MSTLLFSWNINLETMDYSSWIKTIPLQDISSESSELKHAEYTI